MGSNMGALEPREEEYKLADEAILLRALANDAILKSVFDKLTIISHFLTEEDKSHSFLGYKWLPFNDLVFINFCRPLQHGQDLPVLKFNEIAIHRTQPSC